MLEIIYGMPAKVVVVSLGGKITGDDNGRLLIPIAEREIENHEKIMEIYLLVRDHRRAVWDDSKIGLLHLTEYERVALGSDVNWITGAVELFAFMIPCPAMILCIAS